MFVSKLLSDLAVNHGFSDKHFGYNCDEYNYFYYKESTEKFKKLTQDFKLSGRQLVLLRQIHSNKVRVIRGERDILKEGDGLIIQDSSLAIGVLTADCVPILLYDKANNIVSAVHVGWRGALNKILFKTIDIINSYGRSEIFAAIGPCITQKNYEVSYDFFENFKKEDQNSDKCFIKSEGRYFFNLPSYCEDQLIAKGVANIDNLNIDTYDNKNELYSCRRALHEGHSEFGRQVSIIALQNLT